MASMIKGIKVILYVRTETGRDSFNAPVYTELPVPVENVLVMPVSADAVIQQTQLFGQRIVYELCIPKRDAHVWEGCRVEFLGHIFKAFGPVEQYVGAALPLDWDKKVKVERYG